MATAPAALRLFQVLAWCQVAESTRQPGVCHLATGALLAFLLVVFWPFYEFFSRPEVFVSFFFPFFSIFRPPWAIVSRHGGQHMSVSRFPLGPRAGHRAGAAAGAGDPAARGGAGGRGGGEARWASGLRWRQIGVLFCGCLG